MAELKFNKDGRLLFTKEMKKEYTILCPMMLPIHFALFVDVFRNCGYKVELLTNDGPSIVQEGLKYVPATRRCSSSASSWTRCTAENMIWTARP